MPVTKITLSTAMRARDVSRPRADQLTEAAQREEAAGRHPAEPGLSPSARTPAEPAPRAARPAPPQAPAGLPPLSVPPPPRRRRRRSR